MDSFIGDFLVQKEKCKAFGGGQGSSFIRRWKYSYFRETANSLTFTSCCFLASDLACERSAAPHPRANKISALQKNAALLPTVHKQRSPAGFWGFSRQNKLIVSIFYFNVKPVNNRIPEGTLSAERQTHRPPRLYSGGHTSPSRPPRVKQHAEIRTEPCDSESGMFLM